MVWQIIVVERAGGRFRMVSVKQTPQTKLLGLQAGIGSLHGVYVSALKLFFSGLPSLLLLFRPHLFRFNKPTQSRPFVQASSFQACQAYPFHFSGLPSLLFSSCICDSAFFHTRKTCTPHTRTYTLTHPLSDTHACNFPTH